MDALEFDDRLELLGSVLGALLVVTGLGSLLGMPWATNPDLPAVFVGVVGTALTVGVGLALIRLVRMD